MLDTTQQEQQEQISQSTEPIIKTVPAIHASAINTPFVCKNGHYLGLVANKHRSGGGNLKVLILFRKAFFPTETIPQTYLFAELKLGTISCSLCGDEREWNSFSKKKKASNYVGE